VPQASPAIPAAVDAAAASGPVKPPSAYTESVEPSAADDGSFTRSSPPGSFNNHSPTKERRLSVSASATIDAAEVQKRKARRTSLDDLEAIRVAEIAAKRADGFFVPMGEHKANLGRVLNAQQAEEWSKAAAVAAQRAGGRFLSAAETTNCVVIPRAQYDEFMQQSAALQMAQDRRAEPHSHSSPPLPRGNTATGLGRELALAGAAAGGSGGAAERDDSGASSTAGAAALSKSFSVSRRMLSRQASRSSGLSQGLSRSHSQHLGLVPSNVNGGGQPHGQHGAEQRKGSALSTHSEGLLGGEGGDTSSPTITRGGSRLSRFRKRASSRDAAGGAAV